MAQRSFIDADGVEWDVYDVIAQGDARDILRPTRPLLAPDSQVFRRFTAWLCFESRTQKRRLGTIPQGWEDASPDELCRLLSLAEPVKPRPA